MPHGIIGFHVGKVVYLYVGLKKIRIIKIAKEDLSKKKKDRKRRENKIVLIQYLKD